MPKVPMDLCRVLEFVKLGIRNGNYDAAIGLLNDVISEINTDPEKEILRPVTEGVDLHPVAEELPIKYVLENRYLDTGWQSLGEEERFNSQLEAEKRAWGLSKNAPVYGMVRVVDILDGTVVRMFGAGDGNRVPEPGSDDSQ